MKKKIMGLPISVLMGILGLLIVATGCVTTTTDIILPEDRTSGLVEEVLMELSQAYMELDPSGFLILVSPKYIEGYQVLEDRLTNDLNSVNFVDINIIVERVWEEEGMVFVDGRWNRTVSRPDVEGEEKATGMTTFIFLKYEEDVLKLFSMKGDAAFLLKNGK